MASWIYVFSKFTPEALLFESLLICVLLSSYTGFWVLRKRRHGVVGTKDGEATQIPAGVVKAYLNALIIDAEQLRSQLFGLLASAGISMDSNAARAAFGFAGVGGVPISSLNTANLDPETLRSVQALEGKMTEQNKAMEHLIAEKVRIEKELADARAGNPAAAGASGGDTKALLDKIKVLEGKLAEYSVIEDDLANLKRLQQENAQLKAALAGNPAAAAAVASAPIPEPVAAAPAPAPATPDPAPIAAATADPAFEGLVDQVEQSLAAAPAPAEPAAVAEAPAATAPPSGATSAVAAPAAAPVADASPLAAAGGEKSDADLVAEFEKMLNG